MCPHRVPCPPAEAIDREAARVVAAHPEQGWSLLQIRRPKVFTARPDLDLRTPSGRTLPF